MIRDYKIEKQLGKGSYGVVFKVTKKNDKNIYVIKQIPLAGLAEKQISEVKLEAKILSSIKSKYVVKYYDSFEEKNNLNIVMEYCDGGDLNDYIESQKKTGHLLKESIIWKFFIKITIGIADIHKLKILHRDLKTLNIFLMKDLEVRVGDLGVAKVLTQTSFAKTFIGTPYYLSPEICEDKPYNDKSDVWALGCILYELCTYRHPFNARSQGALILKILNGTQDNIPSFYSDDLKKLVNLILEKKYEKRPSCLEILKMPSVIEKAKNLGLYEDIINSFPEIENSNSNSNNNNNNKKIVKQKSNFNEKNYAKPLIKQPSNKNYAKRPNSGIALIGKDNNAGKKFNLNFNQINRQKKNDLGVLNIPNQDNKKKNAFHPKKIKIVPGKDNKSKNKKEEKDPKITEAMKIFQKNSEKDSSKIEINKNVLNNLMNYMDTKELNNAVNDKTKNNPIKIITIDQPQNTDEKKLPPKNVTDENQKETKVNKMLDYSRDSTFNQLNLDKDTKGKAVDSILLKNNSTVTSDIYMDSITSNNNPDNKEKEKEKPVVINNNLINYGLDDTSSGNMGKTTFNQLLQDFSSIKKPTKQSNDFQIITNTNEKSSENVNKSISSDEGKSDDKNMYDSGEECSNDDEEKVKEIVNVEENNNNNNNINKEEKIKLMNESSILKARIDKLKKDMLDLVGEKDYKYIMDKYLLGSKERDKIDEVHEEIENFVNKNYKEDKKEKWNDYYLLFVSLDCQYATKKEELKKIF